MTTTHVRRWVADDSWPASNVTATHHDLVCPAQSSVCSPLFTVRSLPARMYACMLMRRRIHIPIHIHDSAHTYTQGLDSCKWLAFGDPSSEAPDQRADNGRSICFYGAPSAQAYDILGVPAARIRCSVNQVLAVIKLLCDCVPARALVNVRVCLSFFLSASLSLSLFIYVYVCTCTYTYIHTKTHIHTCCSCVYLMSD